MDEEHPKVLVTEASTLHFELYLRIRHMRHPFGNKIREYCSALVAKLEVPTET